MVTSDDIKARLNATPFVPCEHITTTGEKHAVRRRDFVMVAREFVIVVRTLRNEGEVCDRVPRIADSHIASLRDL